MTVKLTKVEGGYQLFVPDELADGAGLTLGLPLEMDVFADQLLVWSPEHRRAVFEKMVESIPPIGVGGEVGFGRPIGRERFWE